MAQTPSTTEASVPWCTIVVPCYNEAARLQPDRFLAALNTIRNLRFVFVNDGSRDETLAVLHAIAAKAPGLVEVLDQQPNAGKAEAVRAGMLRAMQTSIMAGFWDADLATPLDAIATMREELERDTGLEMVLGSRVRLLGRRIHRKAARHYAGRVFATMVSATLGIPIYDSQCGAKLFRVNPALVQIFQESFQSRWIFDVEILARSLSLHRQDPGYWKRAIFETPLREWTEVPGSKVSPSDFLKSLFEIWRIRSRYLASSATWAVSARAE